MTFHYVYILQSAADPDHYYVGLTEDLRDVSHTSKHKPWLIKTAIAFYDRERAATFERYLKSGSGRAFAKRHF